MTDVVIVGMLSLFGTMIGSIAGIMAANKLTNYRIQELEKKVEKHNSVVERTVILERDMKTVFNQIGDMKEDLRHDN